MEHRAHDTPSPVRAAQEAELVRRGGLVKPGGEPAVYVLPGGREVDYRGLCWWLDNTPLPAEQMMRNLLQRAYDDGLIGLGAGDELSGPPSSIEQMTDDDLAGCVQLLEQYLEDYYRSLTR